MSQFRSTGGMDDAIAEDGDRGFAGVNQRLQLNQLQAGEVRESLNGRMEGYWRPRKGIVARTGAFTTGGNPLQLPFLLMSIERTISANPTISGTTVTVQTSVAHGFTTGDFVAISGVNRTSGTNPNGVFPITVITTTQFTYQLTGGIGPYTRTNATATDLSKTISAVSYDSNLVTLTVTGHGFDVTGSPSENNIGTSAQASISGLNFTGVDCNGIQELTIESNDTLTFPVTGVTAVSLGTNPRITQLPINDAAISNVRASCLFSDPNTGNKEYVIVALDTVAKKIDLDENNKDANGYLSSTDIPYPPGLALGADTDMIQVFDKVMLFRDGQQAFEWYPNGRQILSASQFGTTVTVNVREHGLLAGASVTIAGLTGGTPANGTFTVLASPAPTQDTFAYTFTFSQTQDFGVSAATMTDGFTLSPGGDYTQPQIFSIKGNGVEVDSGLVTLTVESNLTLKENDPIVIYESTIPELDSIVGEQYYLTSASINQLQFYAPVPNITVRNLTSASVSGSIVKLITTEDHGLPLGTQINVNEVTYSTGTNPNGIHTTVRQVPNISSATQAANVVTINCSGHGFATNDSITIDGIEFTTGTNPNGIFTITVVNSNTFTYPLTGASGTYVTTNAFATSDDLKKRLLYSLTGVSGTYGVASAYITTASGATSQQVEVGGRFSVGGGFMHQPGAPWGVYFQRRLWVPHYYNPSGAYNAPVYTSSKIKDEIAVSDILDTTTFDQIENQFRVSGGTADYVVGMHGFYEDGLIVFNRNSLHLISGTVGSLLDTKVTELTSEVGCLARKTIVSRGNMVMFLSDDGVYAVEFLNDYNLRGADEPISKNIQPYIDRINKNYVDKSVGVLFDNRYYLAVPLDSAPGIGDARGNNSILVFNFLNKGWESLDTFGDNRFTIENFVLGSAGVRNNIYAITANGGLHQLEVADASNDSLSVSNTSDVVVTPVIDSSLTTRGYDLGTMERKRFTDAQFVMQNLPGQKGEYNIAFAAEDPDSAQPIGTTTDFLGGTILEADTPNEAETAGIRCRLGGIRGYTGTMILTRTVGSPKINSIKVAGSVTNRQIISQR